MTVSKVLANTLHSLASENPATIASQMTELHSALQTIQNNSLPADLKRQCAEVDKLLPQSELACENLLSSHDKVVLIASALSTLQNVFIAIGKK